MGFGYTRRSGLEPQHRYAAGAAVVAVATSVPFVAFVALSPSRGAAVTGGKTQPFWGMPRHGGVQGQQSSSSSWRARSHW